MTRKRCKKLLMSIGYSRNEAEEIIKRYNNSRFSYGLIAKYYIHIFNIHSTFQHFYGIRTPLTQVETFKGYTDNIMDILSNKNTVKESNTFPGYTYSPPDPITSRDDGSKFGFGELVVGKAVHYDI